jgi:hypothetical protein
MARDNAVCYEQDKFLPVSFPGQMLPGAVSMALSVDTQPHFFYRFVRHPSSLGTV